MHSLVVWYYSTQPGKVLDKFCTRQPSFQIVTTGVLFMQVALDALTRQARNKFSVN